MKITSGIPIVFEPDENSDIMQKIPEVDFFNSINFYRGSLGFVRGNKVIHFATGFKCSQCELQIRQKFSHVSYCYYHKRIVDANETCSENTWTAYKNVNLPK